MEGIIHTQPEQLARLSTRELLVLFAELSAPAVSELHGEYTASLLQQTSLLTTVAGKVFAGNPLAPWLGKAFRPVDEHNGRGYNLFRVLGRTIQKYPMQTLIAPSRYDGRPAYQLVYRRYRSLCGDMHMVDEIRRLADGLYLGIGTWGYTDTMRMNPLPFLLEGPVAQYRGDIGKERAALSLQQELPGLQD